MFLATAKLPDKSDLLVMGLSRENITRLMAGQPIAVRRKTHGAAIPPGLEICILFGETEEAIVEQFKKAGVGMLSPN